MNKLLRHSVLVVDLIGTGLMVGCLTVFLSLTVLRADDTADEIPQLERIIADGNRALSTLRTQLDENRSQLERNRNILAQHGKLPEQAPIEEYFSFLSRLADKHRLRVLSHYPLGERQYPGLLEHRYAFEVAGTLPGLVRFFKDVEESSYWADIGYLKIIRTMGVRDADPQERQAQLTVCLFSADAVKEPSTEQG